MALNVWQFDPANLTPAYDIALCEALAAAGCDVRFITSRFLYDLTLVASSAVRTDFLYFRGLNHPVLTRLNRLRRLLRAASYPLGHRAFTRQLSQAPPDILHIQWSRVPRLDRGVIARAKALGIKTVHTVHDIVPLFDQTSALDPLEAVYTLCDALVVHYESNRAELLRRYPRLDPDRVFVVPLIVGKSYPPPPHATRELARRDLGLPPDAPVLLFFGGIRRYKGVDLLAQAFPRARALRPDLHLLVIGRPETDEDAAPLETLRTLPNVLVHSDYVPFDDVWRYHLAADVTVFPYRNIYGSAALTNAMEYGNPAIVTDVSTLPETIGDAGWIVPPEDPDALAAMMLAATADRDRGRVMGERGAAIIRERHSAAVVAEQTIALYQYLLGRDNTSAYSDS